MRGNTIILHLQKGTVTRTGSLYQYDYGQRLILSGVTLPEAYEVHFSNSDLATSKTMIGDATGVDIPDEYLLTGAPVYVWVYLHTGEDDGETEFHGIISVLRRAQPTDQEPTPVQQDVITQTIAALNTAVEEAEAAAASLKGATATAETLAPGSSATATLTESDGVFSFEFGIPQGAKGDQGIQGERGPQGIQGIQGVPGQDGKDGADGKDGQDGAPGADGKDGKDGADGYTPVKGTDYWTDSDKAEIVADASAAVENDIIDDSAGAGDTGKVWSADKSASVASGKYELPSGGIPSTDLSSGVQSSLGLADSAYQKPSGGIPATDLASGVIPDVNSKAPVIIDSVSGAIASFPDGADNLPVESLVVNTEPVQSGSGDPSPENVRPISGASSVNVFRTGKNLFDASADTLLRFSESGYHNYTFSDGTLHITDLTFCGFKIPVKEETQYAWSFTTTDSVTIEVFDYPSEPDKIRNGDNLFYYRQDQTTGGTFTTPAGCKWVAFAVTTNKTVDITDFNLEVGSTASAYEPYTGNSYPVTFPDTVYGGTLNVTTGVLTVYRGFKRFTGYDAENWNVQTVSAGINFYINIPDAKPIQIFSNGTLISNQALASIEASAEKDRVYISSAKNLNVALGSTLDISSISDWRLYLTQKPLEISYELATPITYQLTPTEIKTLLGQNNIWSDAGDVEVTYRADTKLFCQKNDTVDDVRVNGASVVQNGVANVPMAASGVLGVVKSVSDGGILIDANGNVKTYPPGDTVIKAGTEARRPIVPYSQHVSAFYGLAKAAGADMASSSNAVGTYTDAAKVAIQKMLGIYEAPWELIRRDTVTNATEADINVTVDDNGQPFELTDVCIHFALPTQDTQAGKGDYGRVWLYYDGTNSDVLFLGTAWTQNANTTGYSAYCILKQEGSLLIKISGIRTSSGNYCYLSGVSSLNLNEGMFTYLTGNRTYTKIAFTSVLGTAKYEIYGKRKWN